MRIFKRAGALLLSIMLVLTNTTLVSYAATTVAGTTETLSDGTKVHHIDLSGYFNYNSIGAAGDDTTGTNWVGFCNGYGYVFKKSTSDGSKSIKPGYPSNLSFFNAETGKITLNNVIRDESGTATGFSDTEKTEFNIVGLSGTQKDAVLFSKKSSTGEKTINLNQINTSNIKFVVSNKTYNYDRVGLWVTVNYVSDNDASTADSVTYKTNNYASTNKEDETLSYYDYGTTGMRAFARAVAKFKPVALETVTTTTTAEDGTETTTTKYGPKLVECASETRNALFGFRAYEVDVDPKRIVKSINFKTFHSSTSADNRYMYLYSLMQVDADKLFNDALTMANEITDVSEMAEFISELGNKKLLITDTYELFDTTDKEAVAQAFINVRPETGYASFEDLETAYNMSINSGIVSYTNSATNETIDSVLQSLSNWAIIDFTVYSSLSEEVQTDIKAIMLSDKETSAYASIEDIQNAFSAAITKAGINLANSATDENVVSVITELGVLGVIDTSEFLLLDDNAKSVVGTEYLSFFEEDGVFTENSEIVAVYEDALTVGIISYVNAVTTETAGTVIANIGAMSGVLAKSGVGYDKYSALSDEAKAQINEKFASIIASGSVADYAGIAAAFDEAMRLSYISTVVTPTNYAAVQRVITDSYWGYGSYHDGTIGKDKTAATHLKTYINKWEMKNFRGANYMNAYSKNLLTEFYLPLKNAITDIKMNYSVAVEHNNSANDSPSFWILPEKFTLDTSPAVYQGSYDDVVSETNTQFTDWYNFLSGSAWTAVASNVKSGWADLDITAKALGTFQTSGSDYIIVRGGGASKGAGYNGYSITNVPKMKLIYDAAAVLTYINDSSVSGDEKIKALGVSGVLSSSSYGYDGYNSLTPEAQQAAANELETAVANGGYDNFVEFIDSYNKMIEKQLGNVVDSPDVHITFDDETGANTGSNTEITPEIAGTKAFVAGPDGSKALSITNEFGAQAQNYLNVGKYSFGENSFAITFWMRAVDAGVGAGGNIGAGTNTSPVDFTANTYKRGGVVLSNKDFSTNANNGFAMTAMTGSSDMGVNVKIGESEACNTLGIQTAVDSRWHQIAFVVDRNGYATTYVDNKAASTFKIAESSGSIDGAEAANLIFGADGLGQYGMNFGEFDDIRIYSIPLSAGLIEEMYYEKLLGKVNYEAEKLLSDDEASSIYSEETKTALEAELANSKAYAEAYEIGNVADLQEKYNAFNNYYDNFLNTGSNGAALIGSDYHISGRGISSGKGLWLVKSLNDHKELGIDLKTWVNAGDYAETGNAHQHIFFDILDANIPEGIRVMIARGNHDEPANGSRTVTNEDGTTSKISLTRGELRAEFVERMNKYFDNTNEINALVSDENGNLIQPYYYSTDGNAHYLIIDNYVPNTRMISDEQFTWLETILDKISGDGKPIFITQHLPITGSTGPVSGYYLYEQYGNKLIELLNKYENDNIFLVNGHTHNGFGGARNTITDYGNFYQFNLPSFGKGSGYGYAGEGTAVYANFYDDRVVFRVRDFKNDIWLRDYDMTFMLKSSSADLVTNNTTGAVYETLAAAVEAAQTGETITLLGNLNGDGIVIPSGKDITIDLGGYTYTVDGKPVGSAGTETLGFQLLKDSNITIKNGTIAAGSDNVKMLVQNYSNLTLTDVTLDGTGSANMQYVLSNNNGDVKLAGATNITAPENAVAFDVYDYAAGGYTGVNVLVETTGTITGKIEVSDGDAELAISNGTFTAALEEDWCAAGFAPQVNEDGTYGVQQLVSITDSDVTVTNVPENATLIIAAYNGNNLVDAAYVSASNGTKTFEELGVDTNNVTLIKAMIWNVMDPLCKAASVNAE